MRYKTSIVILSYNTLQLLQLCIESIREHTEAGTYEIIVVENASKDGSAAWLKEQSDLRCIYNEKNLGFPKGCNQGLAIATGTELLLLNSDTVVTQNWLKNLRCALYSSPQAGAAGCVTNYCSNDQQIEVPYGDLEEMQLFAAEYNKASDPVRWEKKATLVGFCYLFKREVFEKIGWLDEQFSPGNFEDDDYSLRILQAGYDLLLCRDTFIHHFGSASFLQSCTKQEASEKEARFRALNLRNAALFHEKWHVPADYKRMKPEELRAFLQRNKETQVHRLPAGKEKKIAVLLRRTQEESYKRCLESLNAMMWPEGYEVEAFPLDAGRPYAEQANEVLAATDAKYKLYINDEMCLDHPQMVREMMAIFRDESIGMIGFLGSASLPVSGSVMDSPYKRGVVLMPSEEGFSELRFGDSMGEAADVRFLLPSLFATQLDLSWNESYEKQYYAVLAHCRAMEESGARIVVSSPVEPWCAYRRKGVSFDACEADRKKFFGRWHPYLDGTEPQERNTLYACGEGSEIPSWKVFDRPEGIRIGSGTKIHETALCRLFAANFAGKPRIIIGDRCEIGAGSALTAIRRIEVESGVSLAENVQVKDYVYDERDLGLFPADREIVADDQGIRIERGVQIEENVTIKGALRIGRGSIVRAGSHVQQDVPPYCIVEGSPSRVAAVFSPQEGKWLPAENGAALEKLLEERKKAPPLLTIAFITYNRSKYLKRSLPCVLKQIGNDELAEILVSDNASTDDTRTFVEGMQKKYKNLRYHCNEVNIGAEKNIHAALRESRGEYVLVAGDDDYFLDGALPVLLSGIVRHRGAALFFLGNEDKRSRRVYQEKGCLKYIEAASYFMCWVSCIVMRRELYDAVPEPHKYDDTHIPQVYLQMELLKQRPDFAVFCGAFFEEGGGDHKPVGYNFAEVFIKNYFDILTSSAKIPAEQLATEKRNVLEHSILPWCARIKEEHLSLSLDGVFEIVEEYYGREPYYTQLVEALKDTLKE